MKGNFKPLTNSELKFLIQKYQFSFSSEGVLVKCRNVKTLHDSGFSLLLPLQRRRINISNEAIDIWAKKYLNKYSLLEVQNAMSILYVTYQKVTEELLDNQLKRTRAEIDNMKE